MGREERRKGLFFENAKILGRGNSQAKPFCSVEKIFFPKYTAPLLSPFFGSLVKAYWRTP